MTLRIVGQDQADLGGARRPTYGGKRDHIRCSQGESRPRLGGQGRRDGAALLRLAGSEPAEQISLQVIPQVSSTGRQTVPLILAVSASRRENRSRRE